MHPVHAAHISKPLHINLTVTHPAFHHPSPSSTSLYISPKAKPPPANEAETAKQAIRKNTNQNRKRKVKEGEKGNPPRIDFLNKHYLRPDPAGGVIATISMQCPSASAAGERQTAGGKRGKGRERHVRYIERAWHAG
jgi:hypothetical protein